MWWLVEEFESIRRFLGMGGDVLFAIFILSFLLWSVLLERWFYFLAVAPRMAKKNARRVDCTLRAPKLERKDDPSRACLTPGH